MKGNFMKNEIKLDSKFNSTAALSTAFGFNEPLSWNTCADLINSFGEAYPSNIKITKDGAIFKSKKAMNNFILKLKSFQQAGCNSLSKTKVVTMNDCIFLM